MAANSTNIIYPDLSYKIMGAIFEVHKTLGPGFKESIYEKALIKELRLRGFKIEVQKSIPVIYKGEKVGLHKLDLVVEDKLVILVNFSKSKVEYSRVVVT